MVKKYFGISLLLIGFLSASISAFAKKSSVVQYVNKMCGENLEESVYDKISLLRFNCDKDTWYNWKFWGLLPPTESDYESKNKHGAPNNNYKSDVPLRLAISAYLQDNPNAKRRHFNNFDISYKEDLQKNDYEIENLFWLAIGSSKNATDFFRNEIINEIMWYETFLIDWKHEPRTKPLAEKFILQQKLNILVSQFYFELNMSEVLDQFAIRSDNENMSKDAAVRDICLLEAIIHTMLTKDLQNPIFHRVVFTLHQYEEYNRLHWNDKFIHGYIKQIVDHIPDCLKAILFSNMHHILLFNEHFNFPYGRNQFKCSRPGCQNGDPDFHDWEHVILKKKNFWKNIDSIKWKFTKHYDSIQIHGLLFNAPDSIDHFHFIPSDSDANSCYIQSVCSDDYYLYMNINKKIDYFEGVDNTNVLKNGQMQSYDKNFMWKIIVV